MSSKRVLTRWEPEGSDFWKRVGKRVAARNLWVSMANLLLAFAVWMMWSVVVVQLPSAGFPYTTNELFWLAALPGLSGATLRFLFAFMVPLVGGRRWTVISTALLLLPAVGVGVAVQDPETPFGVMLLLALSCGIGGGNFASSMANISYFFPRAQQGTALGLNGGVGNLGVGLAQFLIPLAITVPLLGALAGGPQAFVMDGMERTLWLQNAAFVWVPFILLGALAAWWWMDDLPQIRATLREQAGVFRNRHTWLLCWLYVGTFGSYVGYAAGFPLLAYTQFPGSDVVVYAFVGPLLGALSRPVGGWLADHWGGTRVTWWVFVVKVPALCGVLISLSGMLSQGMSHALFVAMFVLLFTASGIGNGSVFSMVPHVFHSAYEKERAVRGERGERDVLRDISAALGVTSAIGAYGGFFIPKSYGTSIALTGGAAAAFWPAILFYTSCLALTAWYARQEKTVWS